MKILSCCPRGYFAKDTGTSYEYISFVEIPRAMGHTVHHFDHLLLAPHDKNSVNEFFLSIIRNGSYDLVLIVTAGDEFLPEVLDEAQHYTATLAWNCDDDWRWQDYSSKWAQHYTYMVTTYRHIYEENRREYSNLILSQWGCTGLCEGIAAQKNINISFVGRIYKANRFQSILRLQKELGLAAYGPDVPTFGLKIKVKRRIARLLGVIIKEASYELDDQDAVKAIWNRSQICFTPLRGSKDGSLQIKGRVFDMGLSGSLMLCDRNEALHEFYEPGKEYEEFESLDDCIDKARYYLRHDAERLKIAAQYYKRTKTDHLWQHRFKYLFKQIGVSR